MKNADWQKEVLKQGEMYTVGGVVRDALMGLEHVSTDVDYVVTGLAPEKLEELLSGYGSVYLVGRAFGVYKFTPAGSSYPIDIAYPRKEVSTGAGHKDFKVEWDWSLAIEEDLGRRDFSINAMARCLRTGSIIDPFAGREDIKNKVIRMVFREAFSEDSLRILRGIRFAARFDFSLDGETARAMQENAHLIAALSAERIQDELSKLLSQCTRPSRGFQLMHDMGILGVFLAELDSCAGVAQNEYHPDDVFVHSIKTCDCASREKLALRWAALLHDLGKVAMKKTIQDERSSEPRVVFYQHEVESARIAREVLSRLRYGKDFISKCAALVENHMFYYLPEWKPQTIRRFIRRVGVENLEDIFELRAADCRSRGLGAELAELEEFKRRVDAELAKKHALSLDDMAVDGSDVMKELGIPEGKEIGKILRELFEEVLENPSLNTRPALLELLKTKYQKRKPL